MPSVVVRNLDLQVVETLKARARLRGHSLEQELREILSAAAGPGRADRLAIADRVRAMTPANVPQTDATVLVREDRDR